MVKATHAVDRVPIERGAPSPQEKSTIGWPGSSLIPLMIANLASSWAAVLMSTGLAAHVDGTTGSATWAAVAIILADLPPLLASSSASTAGTFAGLGPRKSAPNPF